MLLADVENSDASNLAAREKTTCSAENIAQGATTGEGAFWQWFGSPPHHANMLAAHRQIGVGRSETLWTEDF